MYLCGISYTWRYNIDKGIGYRKEVWMMSRFASNDEGYLDGERYMQSDLLIIPSRLNLKPILKSLPSVLKIARNHYLQFYR